MRSLPREQCRLLPDGWHVLERTDQTQGRYVRISGPAGAPFHPGAQASLVAQGSGSANG